MRQRILIALVAIAGVAAILQAIPHHASAIAAGVDKGKSDCNALELGITLTYSHDDTGGLRDDFLLEVYDNGNNVLVASVSESITQQQSPYYWQTGRLAG